MKTIIIGICMFIVIEIIFLVRDKLQEKFIAKEGNADKVTISEQEMKRIHFSKKRNDILLGLALGMLIAFLQAITSLFDPSVLRSVILVIAIMILTEITFCIRRTLCKNMA